MFGGVQISVRYACFITKSAINSIDDGNKVRWLSYNKGYILYQQSMTKEGSKTPLELRYELRAGFLPIDFRDKLINCQ